MSILNEQHLSSKHGYQTTDSKKHEIGRADSEKTRGYLEHG